MVLDATDKQQVTKHDHAAVAPRIPDKSRRGPSDLTGHSSLFAIATSLLESLESSQQNDAFRNPSRNVTRRDVALYAAGFRFSVKVTR
jgi:hypothetical protein